MHHHTPISRLMEAFAGLPADTSSDALALLMIEGRRRFQAAQGRAAQQPRPSDHPPHPSIDAANKPLDEVLARHSDQRHAEQEEVGHIAARVLSGLTAALEDAGGEAPGCGGAWPRDDGMDVFRTDDVLLTIIDGDVLTTREKRWLLEDLGLRLDEQIEESR